MDSLKISGTSLIFVLGLSLYGLTSKADNQQEKDWASFVEKSGEIDAASLRLALKPCRNILANRKNLKTAKEKNLSINTKKASDCYAKILNDLIGDSSLHADKNTGTEEN